MSEWETLRDQLGLKLESVPEWPERMTREREKGPYTAGLKDTLKVLTLELRELDACRIVLRIAVREGQFRLDGMPYANARVEHPGVILTFESKHGPLSVWFDGFQDWRNNLRAIAMHLQHLRMASIYGVGRRGQQYRGWKALPSGEGSAPPSLVGTVTGYDRPLDPAVPARERDAYRPVMDPQTAACRMVNHVSYPVSWQQVLEHAEHFRTAWREIARQYHPDRGGDPEEWLKFEEAARVIREYQARAVASRN